MIERAQAEFDPEGDAGDSVEMDTPDMEIDILNPEMVVLDDGSV